MNIENLIVQYDPTERHLHTATLVENASIKESEFSTAEYKTVDVTFDFLCPNCGARHWATETACQYLMSCLGFQLKCGWVSLRFPWSQKTPQRDRESVYGVAA